MADVYAKATQIKLARIEANVLKLEQRIRDLNAEAELIRCGESPIQPGDMITWESGGRIRRLYRGHVIAIGSNWQGYDYKVSILSKDGEKTVGVARVLTNQFPTLEPV